jgi:hypothetical protein
MDNAIDSLRSKEESTPEIFEEVRNISRKISHLSRIIMKHELGPPGRIPVEFRERLIRRKRVE